MSFIPEEMCPVNNEMNRLDPTSNFGFDRQWHWCKHVHPICQLSSTLLWRLWAGWVRSAILFVAANQMERLIESFEEKLGTAVINLITACQTK